MSYDHSSDSPQLALPNPSRIQNLVLFVAGAILIGGGVMAIWWAREALQRVDSMRLPAPLLVGVGLFLAGLSAWIVAATRLRFFFGRGLPVSLAVDLAPLASGTSPRAQLLREDLRQGRITFPEPQGAIDGLLYHLVPNLITSPLNVQVRARDQFFNLMGMFAAFASFAVAAFLTPQAEIRQWLSVGYALLVIVLLLRPLVSRARARVGPLFLAVLLLAAVLAPVGIHLVAAKLPALGGFTLERHVWLMLIGGLVANGLAVFALLRQVGEPPKTQRSGEQIRVSMNTPPSSVMDELDRQLQLTWTQGIPSRRYTRLEPVIDPARHAAPFSGELLEETQPMPLAGSVAPSLGAALGSSRHRWLVLMDLLMLGFVIAAVWLALDVARMLRLDMSWRSGHYSNLGLSAILLLLAAYVQRMASFLWGRFDFESTLVGVEFAGTYQTSGVGTGSVLSRMSTQSQVVRVEAMTLRVWRARIESVVFGKENERFITAMFSTDADAKALAQHLAAFGQAQSVMLAPTADEDRRRMGALALGERLLSQGEPAGRIEAQHGAMQRLVETADAGDAGAAASAGSPAAGGATSPANRFCAACGAGAGMGAKFCAACGTPLAAA